MGNELRVESGGQLQAPAAPKLAPTRPTTSFAERLDAQQPAAAQPPVSGGEVVRNARSGAVGSMDAELLRTQEENRELLKIQIQEGRQDEEKISNLLKAKHDTLKNSIANIR